MGAADDGLIAMWSGQPALVIRNDRRSPRIFRPRCVLLIPSEQRMPKYAKTRAYFGLQGPCPRLGDEHFSLNRGALNHPGSTCTRCSQRICQVCGGKSTSRIPCCHSLRASRYFRLKVRGASTAPKNAVFCSRNRYVLRKVRRVVISVLPETT